MLCRCPRAGELPPLPLILADLGDPTPAALARALGVSASTARRWIATGAAPLAPMLAMFWLTRWGRSQVECHAENAARLFGQVARSQAEQIAELRAELARLLRLADFGAANAPTLRADYPRSQSQPSRRALIHSTASDASTPAAAAISSCRASWCSVIARPGRSAPSADA
jgi:hypothetical protein